MSSDYTPVLDDSEQAGEIESKTVKDSAVLASAATDLSPTGETTAIRPRSGKVWRWSILTVFLIGGVIGGGGMGWRWLSSRNAPAAQAPPPLPVKVETIQSAQVRATAEFVGTLEAQERVSLQPQIQGRIERVLVANGDRVQKGTPIFSLSLDETQADVSGAIAAVRSNRAALATAEAELQAAQANRVRAAADVRLEQVQLKRTQYLVGQGAQAREELNIARNSLETTSATLNAAGKDVQAAQASINEAQSNVQQTQAEVASTQVSLNQKQVVAPISGVVSDILVKVGDYVSVAQTLTSIIKNDALDMRMSVPSNNTEQLRPGLPVELLNVNNSELLTTGSINFISPLVDTSAQSILVKARFGNADGKLRDGQYVRARIVWNQKPGILIPTQAVTRTGGQSFVYMVEEDRSKEKPQLVVHQKPVKLGDVQNERYPILEGIKAGDRLAVSNILQLTDGAPIQPES